MTPWQAFALVTLGFSAAIALLGTVAGVAVLISHQLYINIVFAAGGSLDDVAPIWLAALVIGGSWFVAYWLFNGQQALIRYIADRQFAKIMAVYREVEMALGTEKANEFMLHKMDGLMAEAKRSRLDLFGRAEIEEQAVRMGLPEQFHRLY